MNPEVKKAEPLENYRLKIVFSNEEIREFDVAPFLNKGIFSELLKSREFSLQNL